MKEKLKILIANDDGIRSEGIAKLARAAASFGTVWVAAPEHQCSGMSVRLTISEKSQMAVYRYDFPVPVEAAWSVDGTPADCVKVALNALLPFRPDIVLSGINDGLNAGLDVAYSGTIGAATEAAMHGVPAIAFSMRDDKSFDITDHCSLIYATPSAYGQELAAKVNAGEKLTWEDLDKATWAVQKTSSSAGYIYPSMWLMANYDGKKISDLSNVMPIDSGYGTAFSYAAAESVDIIVCYADGRNDYEASWMLPTDQQDETGKQGMGRSDSIWNEMNVIGVTEGIYNDTVAISKESQYYTPEIVAALQDCFINIIGTDEGKAIFDVYSHTGYAKATDADYDGARAALQAVAE